MTGNTISLWQLDAGVPNLTLRRCPVCQNSSGLYSEQFRNSLTLTQNGCENTGGRGCTHGDDICTSSARYGFIFGVAVLCCFRFCLDCIAAVLRIGGKYQQHICFYAVHLLTCLVCCPFIHPFIHHFFRVSRQQG